LGDEQRTSAIKGSGDTYLKNEVKSLLNVGDSATTAKKKIRHVSNKIVMTYASGSTFYDSIDADYGGEDTEVEAQTLDDKVQDELAMDVVPGTTIKVSSAEVHHMYMYQTANEAAGDANTEPILGCLDDDSGTNANTNPHVVVEYAGEFSQAVSLCGIAANKNWALPSTMAASIVGDITALAGLSINVGAEALSTPVTGVAADSNIQAVFESRFPWAATHSGNARAYVSFTLPMGADGDSFKVHFQRGAAIASGIVRYNDNSAVKNNEFKIFTYRERNNNGRTFTVTKAYENKVSDLLSVSRVGAKDNSGGGLAGVIPSPDGTNGWDNNAGCGATINGNMNPGTYYNVPLIAASAGTTAGAGALAMVIVGGDGKVAEVQITSGGTSLYASTETYYIVDTRLSSAMAAGAAGTRCAITIKDASEPLLTTGQLMKSTMVGARSDMACGTLVGGGGGCTGHADCVAMDTSDANDGAACIATNNPDGGKCVYTGACGVHTSGDTATTVHNVPNTNTAGDDLMPGMRYTIACNGEKEATLITVTAGGNAGGATGDNRGSAAANTNAAGLALFGAGTGGATFTTQCVNDHYYQFGFYNTGTPRWNRDLVQNNYDGATPKDEQVSLYGMKNHMQYQWRKGAAKMAQENFYGIARDTFTDMNSGIGGFSAGYSVQILDGKPQPTTSVITGENGQGTATDGGVGGQALAPMMEHAEKYAYIGKGYDKLTVTPIPDIMVDEKVTITYTGPSAGCSVTEVDRGTHESSECSGRGNCDYTTGTCLCDAGYTLEACSEQTVLV